MKKLVMLTVGLLLLISSCDSPKKMNITQVTLEFSEITPAKLKRFEVWQEQLIEHKGLHSLSLKCEGNKLLVTGESKELAKYHSLAQEFYTATIERQLDIYHVEASLEVFDSLRGYKKTDDSQPSLFEGSGRVIGTRALFRIGSDGLIHMNARHFEELNAIVADSTNDSAFALAGVEPFRFKLLNESVIDDSVVHCFIAAGEPGDLFSILDSLIVEKQWYVSIETVTPPIDKVFPQFKGLSFKQSMEELNNSPHRDSLIQHYMAVQQKESKYVKVRRETEYPVAVLYFTDSLSSSDGSSLVLQSEVIPMHMENRQRLVTFGTVATAEDMDTLPTIQEIDPATIVRYELCSPTPGKLGIKFHNGNRAFALYGGSTNGSPEKLAQFNAEMERSISEIICGMLPLGTIVKVSRQ